jgi:hypothetical protein
MGTLDGSPYPPALWLRPAQPASANASRSPRAGQIWSLR